MTIDDINRYIMKTPHNTNPAILDQMIAELGGDLNDVVEFTCDEDTMTFTSNKTFSEIEDMLRAGKDVIVKPMQTERNLIPALCNWMDEYMTFYCGKSELLYVFSSDNTGTLFDAYIQLNRLPAEAGTYLEEWEAIKNFQYGFITPYIDCYGGSSWFQGALEQWDLFDGEEEDSAVIWYEDADNITYKVTLNSDGSASQQSLDIPKITLTLNEANGNFTSSHTTSKIKQIYQGGRQGIDYLIITSNASATLRWAGEVSILEAADDCVIFSRGGYQWLILTSDESVGLICPTILELPWDQTDDQTMVELAALTSLDLPFQIEAKMNYYSLINKTENTLTFVGAGGSSDTYDFYKMTIDMQSGDVTYTGLTEAE